MLVIISSLSAPKSHFPKTNQSDYFQFLTTEIGAASYHEPHVENISKSSKLGQTLTYLHYDILVRYCQWYTVLKLPNIAVCDIIIKDFLIDRRNREEMRECGALRAPHHQPIWRPVLNGVYCPNGNKQTTWSTIYFIIWACAWQNQQNDLCDQPRLRSAWASTQSDQSLCRALSG